MGNAAGRLVQDICAEAERQGFDVRRPTRGKHIKVYHPNGGPWITNFPLTPGHDARRSVLNSLAPLRRAGLRWPPKK